MNDELNNSDAALDRLDKKTFVEALTSIPMSALMPIFKEITMKMRMEKQPPEGWRMVKFGEMANQTCTSRTIIGQHNHLMRQAHEHRRPHL